MEWTQYFAEDNDRTVRLLSQDRVKLLLPPPQICVSDCSWKGKVMLWMSPHELPMSCWFWFLPWQVAENRRTSTTRRGSVKYLEAFFCTNYFLLSRCHRIEEMAVIGEDSNTEAPRVALAIVPPKVGHNSLYLVSRHRGKGGEICIDPEQNWISFRWIDNGVRMGNSIGLIFLQW